MGVQGATPATPHRRRRRVFAAALLAPGESLGRSVPLAIAGIPVGLYDVAGAEPPRHITAFALSIAAEASRNAGSAASALANLEWLAPLNLPAEVARRQVTLLVVAVVFCVLAFRRRLGVANAVWLAALAGLALLPEALRQPSAGEAAGAAVKLAFESAWLALLWSAGESLWRAADPQLDHTLDLLRGRRLPARAGGALLFGIGMGAAAAGLGLAAYAVATLLPGAHLQALSVDLPVLDGMAGPLASGITAGALVAFLLACGRRLSRRRWVLYAAAVVAALALSPVELQPWPLELGAGAPGGVNPRRPPRRLAPPPRPGNARRRHHDRRTAAAVTLPELCRSRRHPGPG